MGLNADVVKMRVVADLFALGDAAAVADIGLSQLKQVLLEVLCILPARVQTLAVCDGHGVFAAIFSKTLLLSGVAGSSRNMGRYFSAM